MKKLIFSLAICLIGMFVLTSSYSYAKKCRKCLEDLGKNKTRYYTYGIAHIDFSEPYRVIDGKVYALYRCDHGHAYWVCLDD